MRHAAVVALLALGGGWACGASTAPEAPSGRMSVILGGFLNNLYEIEGSYVEVAAGPVTFATARYGIVDTAAVAIVGFRGRGILQDLVQLDVYDYAGPGEYAAGGSVVYGDSRPSGEGLFFTVVSGEIDIRTVHAGRAQGTFHAVALRTEDSIGTLPDTLRLESGTFDVPLLRID